MEKFKLFLNAVKSVQDGTGNHEDYLAVTGKSVSDYMTSGGLDVDKLRTDAHTAAESVDTSKYEKVAKENVLGDGLIRPSSIQRVSVNDGLIALENGEVQSISESNLHPAAEALLNSSASAEMSDDAVTAMVVNYDTSNARGTKYSIADYANAFRNVYTIYSLDADLSNEQRANATSEAESILGQKAFLAAMQEGTQARYEANVSAKSEASAAKASSIKADTSNSNSKKSASNTKKPAKKGKTVFETSKGDKELRQILSDMGEMLNKKGADVVVFYDEEDEAAGKYSASKNTVYINMASNNPLSAFYHESGHMVRHLAGEYWEDIRDMCLRYLAKRKGFTLDQLIAREREVYKNAGHELDDDGIVEELVSQCLEMIAFDENAAQNLYVALRENGTEKSRAQKVREKFKEILKRISDYIKTITKSITGKVNSTLVADLAKDDTIPDEKLFLAQKAFDQNKTLKTLSWQVQRSFKDINVVDYDIIKNKVAKELFEKFHFNGTREQRQEVLDKLNRLYTYMADENTDLAHITAYSYEIANDIENYSMPAYTPEDEMYVDFYKSAKRGKKNAPYVYCNPSAVAEIETRFGGKLGTVSRMYQTFFKMTTDKTKVQQEGGYLSWDDVYTTFADEYRGWFPNDILNEHEMMLEILDLIDYSRSILESGGSYMPIYEEFGENVSDVIATSVMVGYTLVPEVENEVVKHKTELKAAKDKLKYVENKYALSERKLKAQVKALEKSRHEAGALKSQNTELKNKVENLERELSKDEKQRQKEISEQVKLKTWEYRKRMLGISPPPLKSSSSKSQTNARPNTARKNYRNEELIQLAYRYGQYQPNEESNVDVVIPKKDFEGKVVSKSIKTILESGKLSDEAVKVSQQELAKGRFLTAMIYLRNLRAHLQNNMSANSLKRLRTYVFIIIPTTEARVRWILLSIQASELFPLK